MTERLTFQDGDIESFRAKLRDYLASVEFESWHQQGAQDSNWLHRCDVQLEAAQSEIERLQQAIDETYTLLIEDRADEKSDRRLLAEVTNKLVDVAT